MKKLILALALASCWHGLRADSLNVGSTAISAFSTNAQQQAAMLYGADYNGTWRMLLVDSSGRLVVNQTGTTYTAATTPLAVSITADGGYDPTGNYRYMGAPNIASYAASITTLAAASSPTDVLTIIGSATKTVYVTRVSISGTQNTAGTTPLLFIKRSSADTGGTAVTLTAVPADSSSAAATAAVYAFTANPTLGTGLGVASFTDKIYFPTTLLPGQQTIYRFGGSNANQAQPIVLRGVAEALGINFGATTVTGNSINATIEWYEE